MRHIKASHAPISTCAILLGLSFGFSVLFMNVVSVYAISFTVDSLEDSADVDINGVCRDSMGRCTLRAAIQESNAMGGDGVVVIDFELASSSAQTIALSSALPPIMRSNVVIDGTTEDGSSCGNLWGGVAPVWNVVIDLQDTGITILGDNTVIKGLELKNSNSISIPIDFISGDNNSAQCNYIHDSNRAIRVGSGADNTLIGGSAPGQGNVMNYVRGEVVVVNASHNTIIQGNFIGTNALGDTVLNNALHPNDLQFGINVGKDMSVYPIGTVIGGTTPGAGNLLSGFTGQAGFGIAVVSGSHTTIQGNYIGMDRFGTSQDSALGNNAGIIVQSLSTATTIGGLTTSARNVIGNSTLAGIVGLSSSGNTIQGNYIGLGADGLTAIGNTHGILLIGATSTNNMIGGLVSGAGNTIAYNREVGVVLAGDAGSGYGSTGNGNSIVGNSIYENLLGIDMSADPTLISDGITANDAQDSDIGPNDLQNAPVLRRATGLRARTRVSGKLQSAPRETFRIEFFWSPSAGGGKVFLGYKNITTSSTGAKSFAARLLPITAPGIITATATNASGSTSEFSLGIQPLIRTNLSANQEAMIEQQYAADEKLD